MTALLVNIFERKQEARNPFFRVVELTDETVDPAVWGKNFPLQYDGYRRTVDQVRTRYGGSEAVPRTPTEADPRSVVAQSRLEEDPRLKTMWAGYAFAKDFREERGHAYMLDDQTFTERQQVAQAAGHVPALPRVGLRALQEARRRRPDQGLRGDEPDAVRRGAQAGGAPGGLHRLPRPGDDAAARHAARASSRASARSRRAQGVADYDVNTMATRPGDAGVRLRPVPRRVLLQGPREAADLPVGQGAQGRRDPRLLRGERLQGLDARRDRRAGAQGAAPRVRDVEPGHPRALRRRLRRLPHAVPARGRAEDQRPPRAQPAAQHQPRLPDLPQVVRGRAARARRDDPGPHLPAAQPRDGRAGRADRRHQGRAGPPARPTSSWRQARDVQRQAQFLLDFIEAENSMGFHAPQEAMRVLAKSIDYSRQGQVALGR